MRASGGWQLAVPVEDRFDVVPVRVNDVRCVIPGVVMRAKTRRAVVAATGFDSRAVDMIREVPKAEWDSDYRAAMFRPIGPQIEITDDADLERLGSSRRTRDT